MPPPADLAALPLIWVSRCLLGDAVRYDGGHRQHPWMAPLQQAARVRPICPEVEAGLGVPRPPIDIVDRRIINRRSGQDVTDALDAAIAIRLGETPPAGVICKARSPSCGAGSARRFDPDGDPLSPGDGRFIAAVRARWPQVPVCEARHLDAAFFERVWRRAQADRRRLVDFLTHIGAQ